MIPMPASIIDRWNNKILADKKNPKWLQIILQVVPLKNERCAMFTTGIF